MKQFELNPHILPPNMFISPEKHHLHHIRAITAAVLAVLLGLAFYIWGIPEQTIVMTPIQQPPTPSEVSVQLKNSSQSVTPKETKAVISSLSTISSTSTKATTTTNVTNTQRLNIINQLK